MKNFLKSAIAAALLAGASLVAAAPAEAARTSVYFDFGNVSFGYSDGYWDRDHHWHHWRSRADRIRWEREHADHYRGWRHDDRHHRDNPWH